MVDNAGEETVTEMATVGIGPAPAPRLRAVTVTVDLDLVRALVQRGTCLDTLSTWFQFHFCCCLVNIDVGF